MKPGLKYVFFKEKLKKTLVTKKHAQWKEYQMEKEKLYNSDTVIDDEIDDFGKVFSLIDRFPVTSQRMWGGPRVTLVS